MTPEEIRDYLGTMVEVEKECYLHERLLQTLKKRMEPLGHPKNIVKPTMKVEQTNILDSIFNDDILGDIFLGLVEGFFLALVIFIVASAIKIVPSNVHSMGWFLAGTTPLAIGANVAFSLRTDSKERKENAKKNQEEYDAAMSKYNQLVAADRKRVDEENRVLAYLKTEYAAVLKSYSKLKDIRTKLYNMNILYEKYYYNFPAVSSLYEYFNAGRYTTLGEAYNQLELEARLDRISLQLNVVIAKLDQIWENQYTIYSAITEANGKLNSLVSSCSRIEAGVRNLQLQGDELNARVASLQTTSDLNLYINAMNNRELAYIRRWAAN